MAIYHLSAKIISRKSGRSSTGAAAYRAGDRVVDQRTGEVHDYTRKGGVLHSEIVMPASSDWKPTRAKLWNAVEQKNKRADAQVAREFEVALPEELSPHGRQQLAIEFARWLVERYGIAADVAIHAPSKGGDNRNHHAHILTTTNTIDGRGLGNKCRELDAIAHSRDNEKGHPNAVELLRARWAELCNAALERAGHEARVDHRSLKDQGITDRLPQVHLGPAVTQMHRRGVKSDKWLSWEQANEALQAAAEAGRLGREQKEVDRAMIDIETDLSDLLLERKQIEHGVAHSSMAVRQLLPATISERLDALLDSAYYEDGSVVLLYDDAVRDELEDIMSRMDVLERGNLRDALIGRDGEASKLQTWRGADEAFSVFTAPVFEWRNAYEVAREVYMEHTAQRSLAAQPSIPTPAPTTPESDRKPIIQTTPHRGRPRDNGLER